MSGHQSNLSLPQYGYDLVVSITQGSLNATMKQFLDKFDGQKFISCYVSQEQSDGTYKDVPGNYDKLSKIAGIDLFSIPTSNQTDAQKDAADQAYDNLFSFAFKATMGLPADFSLESIPNVIILDKGLVRVTYNLFFKDFQILNAQPQRRGYSWINISQADEPAPWVFQFIVNLDLNSSDSAFMHLPESIQTKVKNLHPNSMFSVQQLYLDLNTARLESVPKIVGLEPISRAYRYLTTVFINSYFKYWQEQNQHPSNPDGNILLGYSIKPTQPSTSSASIIPTDLTFMVSPFRNNKGIPTEDYDMYTLNYLVMSQNHHMPAAVEFGWNWVDKSEKSDYAGTVTIKKGSFVDFLNQQLSQSLNLICWRPQVQVYMDIIHYGFTYQLEKETTPQAYNVLNDGTSTVLTFNYTSRDYKAAQYFVNWANFTVTNTISSNVSLKDNCIDIVTTVTVAANVNLDGGTTSGNFYKSKVKQQYEIGVDALGSLFVFVKEENSTDESDNIHASFWSELMSAGTINTVIENMQNYWGDIEKNLLKQYQTEILNFLSGSHVWIFPGGQTFLFKDVYFSDRQDLVAHLTYVDPE